MEKDREKMLAYIAHLESTNDHLINTLGHCAKLLVMVAEKTTEKRGWFKLIDEINELIQLKMESRKYFKTESSRD